MYRDIKDFFAKHLKDINFDKELIKKLRDFRLRWSVKDPEYIEFLGSNLLGVHTIRFSNLDDEELMYNIYGIDDIDKLQEEVYKVKGIEKKFKVASNIIYLTLAYTAHRFFTNKSLSPEDKEAGVVEAFLIMEYKMFASLYSHYFKYSVDQSVAVTVYERLSHKFILKRLNSWQEVFEYRAKSVLDKKNPNYVRLLRFNTDDAIRILSDIQTKLRTSLVVMYRVLIKVLEEKNVIQAESSTFVGGEKNEKQVKDMEHISYSIIHLLQTIKYNPNDFIDPDLIKVVSVMFNTVNEKMITDVIGCLTNKNYHKTIAKEFKNLKDMKDPYDYIIKKIIEINIEYLQRNDININDRRNIPNAMVMIRYYWSSSKVKNERIDFVKAYLNKLVILCTKKKTKWMIVTLVLAIVVYIFMRGLKKD